MVFTKVDRKAPEIMTALATAPVFKKQGRVHARPAVAGENITTTLQSGAQETTNTAKDGDWIVTNPSGEEYAISEAKFLGRYDSTDEQGVYGARAYCRAIRNPFGKPIEIMAEWGEPQTGDENVLIADICDQNGEKRGNEPYLIAAREFAETYKEVEK
ncbi:MAG: PGDYG domain-containing protein [Candidatus Sungbacteria bacterium]|nr:PGDYG domain-containing protein [Candidatus Sungbacteria bacterium]